jgi:hypothetical protein
VGDGPRAFGEYQAQVKLGADMSAVATMLPEEQDALLKGYNPQPGEGFGEAAKRQDALAKVIEQVRAARAKDPEFKARIEGSIGEAARTGRASNPVSITEFQARLGADAGTAAYNQYRASLRLGRDAQTVTDLSSDEQNALLRSYEPEGARRHRRTSEAPAGAAQGDRSGAQGARRRSRGLCAHAAAGGARRAGRDGPDDEQPAGDAWSSARRRPASTSTSRSPSRRASASRRRTARSSPRIRPRSCRWT